MIAPLRVFGISKIAFRSHPTLGFLFSLESLGQMET
jgi:hypothetical protein